MICKKSPTSEEACLSRVALVALIPSSSDTHRVLTLYLLLRHLS